MSRKQHDTNPYSYVLGYSYYLSTGAVKMLICEIAEKEGKGVKEVLKELGMSTATPYRPMGEKSKRRVLEKALQVLPTDDVLLDIFYDIRGVYGRVIRDIFDMLSEEARTVVMAEYKGIGIEQVPNITKWLEEKNVDITTKQNSK